MGRSALEQVRKEQARSGGPPPGSWRVEAVSMGDGCRRARLKLTANSTRGMK